MWTIFLLNIYLYMILLQFLVLFIHETFKTLLYISLRQQFQDRIILCAWSLTMEYKKESNIISCTNYTPIYTISLTKNMH